MSLTDESKLSLHDFFTETRLKKSLFLSSIITAILIVLIFLIHSNILTFSLYDEYEEYNFRLTADFINAINSVINSGIRFAENPQIRTSFALYYLGENMSKVEEFLIKTIDKTGFIEAYRLIDRSGKVIFTVPNLHREYTDMKAFTLINSKNKENVFDIDIEFDNKSYLNSREIITVYIPIKNEFGKLNGLLGVDLSPEKFLKNYIKSSGFLLIRFAEHFFPPYPSGLIDFDRIKSKLSDVKSDIFNVSYKSYSFKCFQSRTIFKNKNFIFYYLVESSLLNFLFLIRPLLFLNILFFVLSLFQLLLINFYKNKKIIENEKIKSLSEFSNKLELLNKSSIEWSDVIESIDTDIYKQALPAEDLFQDFFTIMRNRYDALRVYSYKLGKEKKRREEDNRGQSYDKEAIEKLKSSIFSNEVDSLITSIVEKKHVKQAQDISTVEGFREFINYLIYGLHENTISEPELKKGIEKMKNSLSSLQLDRYPVTAGRILKYYDDADFFEIINDIFDNTAHLFNISLSIFFFKEINSGLFVPLASSLDLTNINEVYFDYSNKIIKDFMEGHKIFDITDYENVGAWLEEFDDRKFMLIPLIFRKKIFGFYSVFYKELDIQEEKFMYQYLNNIFLMLSPRLLNFVLSVNYSNFYSLPEYLKNTFISAGYPAIVKIGIESSEQLLKVKEWLISQYSKEIKLLVLDFNTILLAAAQDRISYIVKAIDERFASMLIKYYPGFDPDDIL